MSARVLVTGATGFIGRATVSRFLEDESLEVIGCSFSSTPLEHPRYTHVKADLRDAAFPASLPDAADTVVHLAQSRDYRRFPERAPEIFGINVAAAQRLLDWSLGAGVRRFVNMSSGSVYAGSDGPVDESAPTRPLSYYGATKLCAEQLVSQYEGRFEACSLRLFVPYGAGQDDKLIPDMVRRVKEGETVRLAGGAGVIMSPIHVSDVVEAVRRVALGTGFEPGAFNLAGDETVSLAEIVDLIGEKLGREPRVEITDGEPVRLLASTDRIRAVFGFTPHVGLADGIAEIAR